jgi:hypothetical protein
MARSTTRAYMLQRKMLDFILRGTLKILRSSLKLEKVLCSKWYYGCLSASGLSEGRRKGTLHSRVETTVTKAN